MATNPPSFFTPEIISRDTYTSGPVDFYKQALDVDDLARTGVDITDPDDITELEEYGIAGEDGGDSQDDALNALDATSIQGDFVGGSMFPGGTGIEYNNFDAYSTYDSYSDYLSAEKPPGMEDRVDFISNVMEPLTSGRFGDIDFAAGTEGLADRVGKDLTDKKNVGKGIATTVAGIPGALVGSALFSTTTVTNAFGNTSARPDGILGMFADAVHSTQYADMAHNRAVARAVSEFTDSSGDPGIQAENRAMSPARVDTGFSMQFGSGTGAGGITRKAGTFTYTGNMRGLDNRTLKNMEAVQKGFVPSTFNTGFGFDYTGKGATTFEEAGYSGELAGGGRYTDTGAFMDRYGRTSMMGLASHSKSLADKHGLSETEIGSILSATRKGQGKLMDNINAAKADKAAKKAAEDKARAQEQAIQDAIAAGYRNRAKSYEPDDGRGGDDGGVGGHGGGGMSDRGGFEGFEGDARGGMITHGRPQNRNAYAMGTPPPGVQASQSGFVDRPPSQVSEAGKVADNRPMKAPEGTYVINAAAVEFAGEKDIRKMIMDAQKEAVRRGLSTDDFERHSDLVDIAVSSGEVTIAPHLVKIIGEDRLEKINKRGIRKTEQRIAENGQEPVGAAGGGFIDRKKFAKGDRVTLYRGEPLDPSKVTATDYGYGKEDVGKFHTPDVKRAGRFAAGAGKGNQVIKSRKVTIDQLFEGVEEAWKTQGKKKTEYFAKMPKSELDKNLRFVRELKRAYLAGERSLDDMAMFLQEQVFHDDKSRINFIETFKNDPKSAGKLAGRAIAKVATVATPPLAVLAGAAEMLTPSSLGKGTLYDDSFMSYEFTPNK